MTDFVKCTNEKHVDLNYSNTTEKKMTDRELLELAAKADGRCLSKYTWHLGAFWSSETKTELCKRWNPLDDDGQAFRLACDLGLCVYPVARTMQGIACSAVSDAMGKRLSEVMDFSTNIQANTRRAIVRAAAEIGKNM